MMQRFRFYSVVIVPGAVLMALEIVSSRVLAPEFGSSVYVWGSIIGVFLAAMSLGYVLGGHLADRYATLASLGLLLLGAAVVQAVVLLFGRTLVALFGEWTGGTPWGTLLAATVLFGPPTVLLATVAPYAVKLAARDLDLLGGTAGHLFALSTGGSLLGTLGATFALIPYLELESILRLLLALTALTGAVAVGPAWRDNRPAAILVAVLAVFITLGSLGGRGENGLLAERLTPYQTLRVSEQDGVRFLYSDGTLHAAVDLATREPWVVYQRTAPSALLLQPEISSVLVLGMGGGTAGTYMQRRIPGLRVDYVDIDPAVPELARRYMFFDGDPATVHVADARRFLSGRSETWDFIFVDCYIGHSIPFHLVTLEFFQEARERLSPGGVIGINMVQSPGTAFGDAVLNTLHKVFPQVYVFNVPGGNYILLAGEHEPHRSREEMLEMGRALDQRFRFDPSLTEIAGFYHRGSYDLSSAQLLRDRFAPVNHLLFQEEPAGDVE